MNNSKSNGAAKANGKERLKDQDFQWFWDAPHCNPMQLMQIVRPMKLEFGLSDSAIVDLVRVALAYLDGEREYFEKAYPGLSWVDRLEDGTLRKPKRAIAAKLQTKMLGHANGSTTAKAEG